MKWRNDSPRYYWGIRHGHSWSHLSAPRSIERNRTMTCWDFSKDMFWNSTIKRAVEFDVYLDVLLMVPIYLTRYEILKGNQQLWTYTLPIKNNKLKKLENLQTCLRTHSMRRIRPGCHTRPQIPFVAVLGRFGIFPGYSYTHSLFAYLGSRWDNLGGLQADSLEGRWRRMPLWGINMNKEGNPEIN